MKRFAYFSLAMGGQISIAVGFIRICCFLFHIWGVGGIIAAFLFVPPLIICPVWEWIATGSALTFLLVYIFGVGAIGLAKVFED